MSVAENIEIIEERLIKACDRSGRKRSEIILMGVSKFVPKEKIKEAFCAGIRYFGESRVQEAAEKIDVFRGDGTRLHLIGSLQRNKAKQAMKIFDCIQSVDRIELVNELIKLSGRQQRSSEQQRQVEILLELHTGEETKSGFADMETLFAAAELVLGCSNLKPSGLMTMAPYTTDKALIRTSFLQLVKAQKELKKRFGEENWDMLSMGMSNDFEIAIEEGSTLLRIGSAIFKE
ncbi:MAG: YggS family pyridoxal phosphate-dependent enzyme [Treponema sp.]|nr:YggS family pyridoxal phosphate-dependent enzyme [Treponema sp.]